MKKAIVILGIIFILGLFLRFYRLGDVPVGFHRDEAFLGFNAYSIMQTGRDMNGNFLPLHLESFLYSPAGYSYFSIPFIKLFDLNPFSVRFASALFGALSILAIYLIARELFSSIIGLFSAAILAVSPWHINLSRTATENTVVVFFILLGIWFFLLWLKSKRQLLILTAFLSFALTLLLYQAPRAFLPLLIPLMFFILAKYRFNLRKNLILIILFLTTIILPLIFILFSQELSLRIRTINVFSTQGTQLVIDEFLREDGVSAINTNFARIFHNKLAGYSLQFTHNYFKHFSFDFLFADQGFPIRYKIPNSGLLYLFELPFFLIGLVILLRKKSREGLFLFVWLLVAPVGSALTFDDIPNLQRTLITLPALAIIEAFGFLYFFTIFSQRQKLAGIFIGIIVLYSISAYLHQYYVHGPRYRPWYRQDGYKELVAKTNLYFASYDKIVITNHESAPAIFFLFFNKYNPQFFQQETKESLTSDFDRIGFGKYEFSQEECPLREEIDKKTNEKYITGEKNVLYVNFGACKVPKSLAKLKDLIKRRDQTTVFQILEVEE